MTRLAILVAGSLLAWSAHVAAQKVGYASKPLWSFDVVQTIGTLGTYEKPRKHINEVVRFDPPGVIFLDNDRLIVYEAEPTGQLSSRTSPDAPSSSYLLHMSVVNARSGRVLFTKDWPLHPYNQFL